MSEEKRRDTATLRALARSLPTMLTFFAGIAVSVSANLLTGSNAEQLGRPCRCFAIIGFFLSGLLLILSSLSCESALEEARDLPGARASVPERWWGLFFCLRGLGLVLLGGLLFAAGAASYLLDVYAKGGG